MTAVDFSENDEECGTLALFGWGSMKIKQSNKGGNRELTPPYARCLVHLIRPFPDFDFFFMRSLRQQAVRHLQLKPGDRVLDAGCGPGGSVPYLVDAVGPAGEVVGVEISPEMAINARRRIRKNCWSNVRVVEADAKSVKLERRFDGMLLFAAADIYASPQALGNLIPYLRSGAGVAVFGAKLSRRGLGKVFNLLLRSLWKLSFSSAPALNDKPWALLENNVHDLHIQEHCFGCMFLAWGSITGGAVSLERQP